MPSQLPRDIQRSAFYSRGFSKFRARGAFMYIMVVRIIPPNTILSTVAPPLFNLLNPRAVSRFFALAHPYTVNTNYILREVSTLSVIIRPQLPPKHGRRKRPKNRIVKRSSTFLCNLLLELQP